MTQFPALIMKTMLKTNVILLIFYANLNFQPPLNFPDFWLSRPVFSRLCIIYIESGKFPLHCQVKKAQVEFWLYVNDYVAMFPEAALSKVVSDTHSLAIEHVFVDPEWHVVVDCPLTRFVISKNYQNLQEICDDQEVQKVLFSITKVLKIPI